jgi:hypothetical protein
MLAQSVSRSSWFRMYNEASRVLQGAGYVVSAIFRALDGRAHINPFLWSNPAPRFFDGRPVKVCADRAVEL